MDKPRSASQPPVGLVIAAFAAVYIIWGSTYLAIRVGVDTIPPFMLAGVRFLVAGLVLYLVVRMLSNERPTWTNWRATTIVGGLLLLGGNGVVCWAEQTVPSGLAALLITTVPIWMVLLHWMRHDGRRPTLAEGIGVSLGFVGVALLIGGGSIAPGHELDRIGAGALVLASLSWAFGSLYSRSAPLPKSPFLATAMEMLCGGALLMLVSIVRGELFGLNVAAISLNSLLALAYLTVFGSLVAFTAYVWLLRVATPARVATYAFVNPVVAVLLGWAILGEPFTPRYAMASVVIVVAVALVITSRTKKTAEVPAAAPALDTDAQAAKRPSFDSIDERPRRGEFYTLADVRDRRVAADRRYFEFLRVPSMSAGVYHLPAGGEDTQQPHEEDEVYVVLKGASDFRMGAELRPVRSGDVIYVPARLPHRFENIEEDMDILVLFSPAETGSGADCELELAECS